MREIVDLRGKMYDLEKDCLRLMAENLKLKQALKKIAIGGCECCTEGSLFRDEMIDEARAALEEK